MAHLDGEAIARQARDQHAAAIVFDHARTATVEEVMALAPNMPNLRSRRRRVERVEELGRNERGQRVQGTRVSEQFASYERVNELGELTPVRDGELRITE